MALAFSGVWFALAACTSLGSLVPMSIDILLLVSCSVMCFYVSAGSVCVCLALAVFAWPEGRVGCLMLSFAGCVASFGGFAQVFICVGFWLVVWCRLWRVVALACVFC